MSKYTATFDQQEVDIAEILMELHQKHSVKRIRYQIDLVESNLWHKTGPMTWKATPILTESAPVILALYVEKRMPLLVKALIKKYYLWFLDFQMKQVNPILSSLCHYIRIHGFVTPAYMRVQNAHSPYYPRCWGYCLRCGDPATMAHFSSKRNKDSVGAVRMARHSLRLMHLCYICSFLGFDYDVEAKKIQFPSGIEYNKHIMRLCFNDVAGVLTNSHVANCSKK